MSGHVFSPDRTGPANFPSRSFSAIYLQMLIRLSIELDPPARNLERPQTISGFVEAMADIDWSILTKIYSLNIRPSSKTNEINSPLGKASEGLVFIYGASKDLIGSKGRTINRRIR